jgi:hypothetical protein
MSARHRCGSRGVEMRGSLMQKAPRGIDPGVAQSAMHLIQILLPLYDNAGTPFPPDLYSDVRHELTERFGGLTAFTRAPAQGLWKNEGKTTRDDIVVFEVMAAQIDAGWWAAYRKKLEAIFRQDTIIIRAQPVTIL